MKLVPFDRDLTYKLPQAKDKLDDVLSYINALPTLEDEASGYKTLVLHLWSNIPDADKHRVISSFSEPK